MSWFFQKKSKKLGARLSCIDMLGRDALTFDAMEPRLLLSADAFGGVIDGNDADFDVPLISNYDKIRDDLHHKWIQSSPSYLLNGHVSPQSPEALDSPSSELGTLDLDLLNAFFSGASVQDSEITQLVFVDAEVERAELLLADAYNDISIKVITIGDSDNPLREMTEELSKYHQLDSIHIVSHGSSGELSLGGVAVDSEFLQQSENAELLQLWKKSTTDGADLLVYGCNFAQGSEGSSALKALSTLSQLDVAASNDITGFGGDWSLEENSGSIESGIVVGLDVQDMWQQSLQTIVVNSTEDDGLKLGISSVNDLIQNEDEISLREAILAVNQNFGANVHTIVFDLPDSSVIQLESALPDLDKAVIIDGSMAWGNATVIGSNDFTDVFTLTGNGIELRNLNISGGDEGVLISGQYNLVVGSEIAGNSGNGIEIVGASNQIGAEYSQFRNLISGNSGAGILIDGPQAINSTIVGNWIGLSRDGSESWGNSEQGIAIKEAYGGHIANNVISGNLRDGINISRGGFTLPQEFFLVGNTIGLDVEGETIVSNGRNGIELFEVEDVRIGDGTDTGRNVISGNVGAGIIVIGENTDNIKISGNYIGSNLSGTVALGNADHGVQIYDGPSTVTPYFSPNTWTPESDSRIYIGGSDAEGGNLISGNGKSGIYLDLNATDVAIVNNRIGLDATGTGALGNTHTGIQINVDGEVVTEMNAEIYIQGNTIAHNGLDGVSVLGDYTYGVHIYENAIFANGELGIDLGDDGVDVNDAGDFDGGVNRRLNYPEITSVQIVDGLVNVQGSLNINSAASGTVIVDFYSADDISDNGNAYAEQHIGTYTFNADSIDSVNFDVNFDVELSSGAYITATSHVISNSGTSEFATAVQLSQGNVSNTPASGTLLLGGSFIQGATLTLTSNLSDANGISNPINYQWRRDGFAINGANDETYELTQEDVGSQVSVVAYFTDDEGYAEFFPSLESPTIDNVNDLADGQAISFDGSRQEDATITAVTSSITDLDGISNANFTYQWLRNGEEIIGAEDVNYTLGDLDVDARIAVVVSFIDDLGSEETVVKEVSGVIENVNDDPSGNIILSGVFTEDQTLTVDTSALSDSDGLPAEFNYSWYRNGALVTGANADTYTLSDEDVDAVIYVVVSYEDGHQTFESRQSNESPAIQNVNDEHEGTLLISGSNVDGETLTAQVNFTDADGLSDPISFQWYRDEVAISGATSKDYTVTNDDVGARLNVEASYVDDHGNTGLVISEFTSVVNNTNQVQSGYISILGSLTENSVLSVDLSNLNDPDGIPDASTFNYQWLRDGELIIGETDAVYALGDADVGASISVNVSYVDNYGSSETVYGSAAGSITNVNDAPQGEIEITGSMREGSTLTAEISVTDDDGFSGSNTYQWLRDGVEIQGANAIEYTLTDNDVGANISFRYSYIDAQSNAESFESELYGPVSNLNQLANGTVDIVGTFNQGETLNVQLNVFDGDGLPDPSTYEYQWFRSGVLITGANNESYVLTQDDVGHRVSLAVSFVDDHGAEEIVSSALSNVVLDRNDGPTGQININGSAIEFETLTVTNTVTDLDGIVTDLGYQWYRDGEQIEGAFTDSYTLQNDDVGSDITVVWRYIDGNSQTETARSAVLTDIQNQNTSPTGSVVLQGVATEGERISIVNSISDADGIDAPFSYQWYRNGEQISGAVGVEYILDDADVGKNIQVVVSYRDSHGTEENLASGALINVIGVNDDPTGELYLSGSALEGSVITLIDTIEDDDGIVDANRTYTWLRNGQVISGAVGKSYTLNDSDVDSRISANLQYTDEQGFVHLVSTAQTNVVAEVQVSVDNVIPPLPGQRPLLPSMADDVNEETSTEENQGSLDDLVISSPEPIEFSSEEESQKDTTDNERSSTSDLRKNSSDELSDGRQSRLSSSLSRAFDSSDSDTTFISNADSLINQYDLSLVSNTNGNNTETNRLASNGGAVQWVSSVLAEGTSSVPDLGAMLDVLNSANFNDSLNRNIQEYKDDNVSLTSTIVGGTAAASTSLSVGYLIWTMRSGVLMTSLLSSLPAWRFIDPLPILGKDATHTEDDESLEEIVEEQRSRRDWIDRFPDD